jgi:hypothetical protein
LLEQGEHGIKGAEERLIIWIMGVGKDGLAAFACAAGFHGQGGQEKAVALGILQAGPEGAGHFAAFMAAGATAGGDLGEGFIQVGRV